MNPSNSRIMLALSIALLLSAGCSGQHSHKQTVDKFIRPAYPNLPQDNPATDFTVQPLSNGEQLAVTQVLENTNRLRREKGLPELRIDPGLNAYAKVRAHELPEKFSHTRPDGSDIASGIEGSYIGENIAAGTASAEETVMRQWRNSKGHYENIINPQYTTIGIGIAYAPGSRYKYYWVQVFSQDNVKSKYQFAQYDRHVAEPAVEVRVQGNRVNSTATEAFKQQTLKHPIYANTLRRNEKDGTYALIQDPNGVFTYQTFAEIYNAKNQPVDYLNIGIPVPPAEDAIIHAAYRGASVGNYGQHSHVYAEVKAKVTYDHKQKSMDITFDNSKMAEYDIAAGAVAQQLIPAPLFNFRDTLHWDKKTAQFLGNGVNARFYGNNGEEIGGQFQRSVQDGIYKGAFGAKQH